MDSKQRIHVMTLANSIIGVSILAMPFCFKQCGIALSILLLLFSSVVCRLACHFLLKSAIKARLRTFEFLAYYVFGSVGKLFVEIGMIGFLLGTCVAFFVVMGDLSPQIIAQLTETKSLETLRTTILVALGLLCVLPLGLLRNVDSLSSVCIATIIFYAALVFKIFLESAPQLFNTSWYEHVDFWRPSGVLQCIPIFSMALFCQTQLFEIYQAIPNASLDKMNEVVKIAVNICTSVYIFVGVFGYIAVSHKPNFSGNILMDFEPSVITETMKLGFVLSVAFSFPLIIFPCRASLYSLLYRPMYTGLHDSTSLYIPEGKFRFLTLVIVIVSLIIGILIPNIELVLGLVGSTIGIMICVIFPATCFICLTNKNTNERILAQMMLVIGIGVMVLGTYANLYAIDHIDPIPNYDRLAPMGLKGNSKDDPINLKLPENIGNHFGDLKSVSSIDKEMQIKIPDAVKEVRHEPVQPEEPLEAVEDKIKVVEDAKQEVNIPEPAVKQKEEIIKEVIPGKQEETLAKAYVSNDEAKIEQHKLKEGSNLDTSIKISEKLETKDQPIEAVDIEAIKKEDQELEKGDNLKENFVAHEKLVAEEKKIYEENKKILAEIKEAQQKVKVEKLKAVQNIQKLVQKAIETIVDEDIKDPETLQKVVKENVGEIKSIVEQGDKKDDGDILVTMEAPAVISSHLKLAPLSYQLGLDKHVNKTIKKREDMKQTLNDSIVSKHDDKKLETLETRISSVVKAANINIFANDLDVKQNHNVPHFNHPSVKKVEDADIIKKNITDFANLKGQKASLVDVVKGEIVNDKRVEKKIKDKSDNNVGIQRDILSKDYVLDHARHDVDHQENGTGPSAA